MRIFNFNGTFDMPFDTRVGQFEITDQDVSSSVIGVVARDLYRIQSTSAVKTAVFVYDFAKGGFTTNGQLRRPSQFIGSDYSYDGTTDNIPHAKIPDAALVTSLSCYLIGPPTFSAGSSGDTAEIIVSVYDDDTLATATDIDGFAFSYDDNGLFSSSAVWATKGVTPIDVYTANVSQSWLALKFSQTSGSMEIDSGKLAFYITYIEPVSF